MNIKINELFEPVILRGDYCTLIPLSIEHHLDLIDAVKDGELWNLWYTLIPEPEKMMAEIERRLEQQAAGNMIPFTIIDNQSQKPIGMTTYMNIDSVNRRLEIGYTWYRKQAQRTKINTDCKFLLLNHAFESLKCIAVEFRTNAFNHQSRRSIERLGAKLDGILRNFKKMPNGSMCDAYVYSIIENEWSAVKAHLDFLKHKK